MGWWWYGMEATGTSAVLSIDASEWGRVRGGRVDDEVDAAVPLSVSEMNQSAFAVGEDTTEVGPLACSPQLSQNGLTRSSRDAQEDKDKVYKCQKSQAIFCIPHSTSTSQVTPPPLAGPPPTSVSAARTRQHRTATPLGRPPPVA